MMYDFHNVGNDLATAYNEGYEDGKRYASEKFAELVKKELITFYLSKRCDEICAGIINNEEHI